jgi:peptide/nickel transport system permease protein
MKRAVLPGEAQAPREIPEETPLARAWSEFTESRSAVVGLILFALIAAMAVLAPWITPQDPYDLAQLDIMDGNLAPGAASMTGAPYWLGTDDQGRDMLSAIIYGRRMSLGVAALSTLIALLIGMSIGVIAAYFGGRIDSLIMRVVDLQLSFPVILVALILLAILGKGVDKVIFALIIVQWAYYARTVRGTALVERRKEYIEAAACLALSHRRVVFSHLLPNCLPPLIVVATVQVANAIALEATLSFLGVGVPITEPSLGLLIANGYGYLLSGDYGSASSPESRWLSRSSRSTSWAISCAMSSIRAFGAEAPDLATGPPTLEVRHLRTWFYTRDGIAKAVDDVSLTVGRGEILGLVGESGSGKTVTGFSILGLVDEPGRIVDGEILLNGADLVGVPEDALRHSRGRTIAMIFQDPMMTLNPVLRIDTQMIEAITAHEHVSRDEAFSRARAALTKVGIAAPDERLRAYPHQFSGGMRQRVAIAIALLHQPDLIIADEPTTALDVTIQAQILYEMQKLAAETGVALIWITHDLAVVAGLVDRVSVMYAGRIVEEGPVDAVIDQPLHPIRAA